VKQDTEKLVNSVLSGNEVSLSRLLSVVENDTSEVPGIIQALSPHEGKAYRIGLTGTPGSGKSTLIDKLIAAMRGKGLTVGVICVDPTSPLTGGAVLGDRIRMEQHFSDEGVFIRSMATRGNFGGISQAVDAAVALLDAFGKDVIIVETVGVGQEEISITKLVHTTVLVLAPGWGDSLQLMKAGILEVADVIVANKADEMTDGLVDELRDILALSSRKSKPPILITEAINNTGIEEFCNELIKKRNEKQSDK
jgi:LAO/AO transport system kinase